MNYDKFLTNLIVKYTENEEKVRKEIRREFNRFLGKLLSNLYLIFVIYCITLSERCANVYVDEEGLVVGHVEGAEECELFIDQTMDTVLFTDRLRCKTCGMRLCNMCHYNRRCDTHFIIVGEYGVCVCINCKVANRSQPKSVLQKFKSKIHK